MDKELLIQPFRFFAVFSYLSPHKTFQANTFKLSKLQKIFFFDLPQDFFSGKSAQRTSQFGKKIKKFLTITNEMLLEKKRGNKNFFFNQKRLIFVPPLKNFFSVR